MWADHCPTLLPTPCHLSMLRGAPDGTARPAQPVVARAQPSNTHPTAPLQHGGFHRWPIAGPHAWQVLRPSPSAPRAVDACVVFRLALSSRWIMRMPATRAEQTDKLIAVLANDPLWASAKDIPDVPDRLVEGTRSHVRPHKLGVG